MKVAGCHLTPFVLALLLVLSALPLAQGQGYLPIHCWPGYDYYCSMITNWVDAVDLNNDGDAEFLHWSFETEQSCMVLEYGQPVGDEYTDDTEALFPTEHVQLYVGLQPSRVFFTAVLTNGQPVVPEPKSAAPGELFWEWNAPEAMAWLQIVGLGAGDRAHETVTPFGPPYTVEYSSFGYLNNGTNSLFAFRVSKPDGWHLGWLRLVADGRWRPDGLWSSVQLTEYDVHPEPNTEIRAGQYAEPRLQVALAGDKVIVSWPPGYRGCTLERTVRLDPPAWQPGPPVSTNSVIFDASDAPWYFRLRR